MASIQGDSGVTDFSVISSRPGFMLHAEIQGKQVLVPVSGLAEGLGDKFAPLLGEGWAEKGQFAFGPGSRAQYSKENPPVDEELVEPVLFSATATAEGVTQELEDLPCLIIDPRQGASASVTYAGQTYEMPTAPEGAPMPYVVAYIFPKSNDPDQVAPAVGRYWYSGLFEVFEVTEVPGGWMTMSYIALDEGEEFPPVFPLDGVPGTILLLMDNLEDLGVSYAFGENSIASGMGSIASGENSTASGDYSIALGADSIASGTYSTTLGADSTASGDRSTALGIRSTASGAYSTTLGTSSAARGRSSIASGENSLASGSYSIALGTHSTASGRSSIASGENSTASGAYSTTLGAGSTASGAYSTTLGAGSAARGDYSIALGAGSTASGRSSIASGENSLASGDHSTALGAGSTASGASSTVIGRFNLEDFNKIFILGNGTSTVNRKNIFTIDYDGKPDSAQIPSVNGGDLVVLGIVPPAAKPAFAGQIYLDANNKKLYVAKAATATTDWVAIN